MKSKRGKTTSKTTRKPTRRKRGAARHHDTEPAWVGLADNELLEVRMCDLGLRIEGTPLEERIERLYEELESRDIQFRPHFWLSDEWFSPDGVPGIAIPFYLAHPRLARLENRQMLEVEGGTEEWCLKILRHETGHTIDTAYRLHNRRRWRDVFGKYSEPYPEYYSPKPHSKSYVLHLEPWYAQSHPAEDFAETFAVWLKPRSRWRTTYKDWPALKKVEYVDQVMGDIGDKRPAVSSRRHIDPLRTVRKTLGEHYAEKRKRYGIDQSNVYDRDLCYLFSDDPKHAKKTMAAAFLRRHRTELRRVVAYWTGEYQYTIDQVLREMIHRCRELKLRLGTSERDAKRDAIVMLTVQTMNYLHAGRHRIAL